MSWYFTKNLKNSISGNKLVTNEMRQGSVLSFLQSIGVNMDTLESVHSVQYVAKSPPADREELDGTGSQAAGGKHINLNDRKTSN